MEPTVLSVPNVTFVLLNAAVAGGATGLPGNTLTRSACAHPEPPNDATKHNERKNASMESNPQKKTQLKCGCS